MRPMSRHFVEIHGVDVSDEMIALRARKAARHSPTLIRTSPTDRASPQFADESFDFVYSYAVFQHIPSREVVFAYLRETHRVMKTGGLARAAVQRPAPSPGAHRYLGWRALHLQRNLEFARRNDFQVLRLEGVGTQYMWTTWRKQPRGWHAAQENRAKSMPQVHIRRITNANSSEPVAPCRGRFASISIWVENLPADAGLHQLQVTVGSSFGTVCYIGPPDNAGLQQVNVMLPELEATGLLPVEILWLGRRISPPATLRVIPPGPSVPRIRIDYRRHEPGRRNRIETRYIKVVARGDSAAPRD